MMLDMLRCVSGFNEAKNMQRIHTFGVVPFM